LYFSLPIGTFQEGGTLLQLKRFNLFIVPLPEVVVYADSLTLKPAFFTKELNYFVELSVHYAISFEELKYDIL